MRPKIMVIVEGGCVQSIVSDRHVDITIVDRDNMEAGEESGLEYQAVVDPDFITRAWGVLGTRDKTTEEIIQEID